MTLLGLEELPRSPSCVMARATIERFCPLEQGRNFKSDVERHLELGNFDKALNIAKTAVHCVDTNLRHGASCDIEEQVLKIFREEFVRYIDCVIPSRKRDLLTHREREAFLAQQERELERVRNLAAPSCAHMESLYYIVDKHDYSSMHPAVASPSSTLHTLQPHPPLKTQVSPTLSGGDDLSPPVGVPKAAPTEMEASVYAPSHSLHRSPPPLAACGDPLQFSSVESPHCSFYDTFSLHPCSINSMHPWQTTMAAPPPPTKSSPIKLALQNSQIHYANPHFHGNS